MLAPHSIIAALLLPTSFFQLCFGISASFGIQPLSFTLDQPFALSLSSTAYIQANLYGNLVDGFLSITSNYAKLSPITTMFFEFENGIIGRLQQIADSSYSPDSLQIHAAYDGTNLTFSVTCPGSTYQYYVYGVLNTGIASGTVDNSSQQVLNISAYGYVGDVTLFVQDYLHSLQLVITIPYSLPVVAIYPPTMALAADPVKVSVVTPASNSPITYQVSVSGTPITSVQSPYAPNYDTWLFTPPINTHGNYTITVSNNGLAKTSSLYGYAPSVSNPFNLLLGTDATIQIDYLYAFSSYSVYNPVLLSSAPGTDYSMVVSAPVGAGHSTFTISQGMNAAVVTVNWTSSIGITVSPDGFIFGGNFVSVTVTNQPYINSSITYVATVSGTTFASSVSPSASTTWSFQAPTNMFTNIMVFVTNGPAATSTDVPISAPVVRVYQSVIGPLETRIITMTGFSEPGSFTVYSAAASLSQQSVATPSITYVAPATVGADFITISQTLNSAVATFTVTDALSLSVLPDPSAPADGTVLVSLAYALYNSSITFQASLNGTLFSETTVSSTQRGFRLLPSANTAGSISVHVTNGPASISTTIPVYTPTFVQPATQIPRGTSLYVTFQSISTGDRYTAIFHQGGTTVLSVTNYGFFPTLLVPISSTYVNLYTLEFQQFDNTLASLYTVGQVSISIAPTDSVFGGDSVTVSLLEIPYQASSISYAAEMTGSTFAATTLAPISSTWAFQAPVNMNQLVTVHASTGIYYADSATLQEYAPSLIPGIQHVIGGNLLRANVFSLNTDLSYSATFCGESTTLTGQDETVTFIVPTTSCYSTNNLTISQGLNQAIGVYSVTNLFLAIQPSPSVNGGQTVLVTVLTTMAPQPLTYLAILSGSTLGSNVSASTQTTWAFSAPTNVNALISVEVVNDSFTAVSTLSLYAPTIAQTNNGTIIAGQLVVTPTGINTSSPYTIRFDNGIFSFVNTLSGTATDFTLPVPRNYIGQFLLTLTQSPNNIALTYTVTNAPFRASPRRQFT